jgi:hypothetical protein
MPWRQLCKLGTNFSCRLENPFIKLASGIVLANILLSVKSPNVQVMTDDTTLRVYVCTCISAGSVFVGGVGLIVAVRPGTDGMIF